MHFFGFIAEMKCKKDSQCNIDRIVLNNCLKQKLTESNNCKNWLRVTSDKFLLDDRVGLLVIVCSRSLLNNKSFESQLAPKQPQFHVNRFLLSTSPGFK